MKRSRKKHRKHIATNRPLHFGAKASVTWKAHENIGEEHNITQGRTEVEAKLFRLEWRAQLEKRDSFVHGYNGRQGIEACIEEDGY